MGELLLSEKSVVIPGEMIATGMDYLPSDGAFREKEHLYAGRLGLVYLSGRLVKVVPLSGRYIPKKNDTILGTIVDIGYSGWRVDFGWPFQGNISMKDGSRDFIERGEDLSRYYSYGDLVVGKIVNVVGSRIIDITMNAPGLRKLEGGRIILCGPAKVPRIIGKQGSMIGLIKDHTGCHVMVGQNGIVWISGETPEQELKAIAAIRMIEEQAHISGLTDKVKEFLEKK